MNEYPYYLNFLTSNLLSSSDITFSQFMLAKATDFSLKILPSNDNFIYISSQVNIHDIDIHSWHLARVLNVEKENVLIEYLKPDLRSFQEKSSQEDRLFIDKALYRENINLQSEKYFVFGI